MFEILKNFESAMSGAERLNPAVLIGSGVTSVVFGLIVWLGGLSLKRWLAGITGGIGGGIIASLATGLIALPVIISAVLAAIMSMIFERVFITAFAAGLCSTIGIGFLIGPYIVIPAVTEQSGQSVTATEVTILDMSQSIGKVKIWAADTITPIRTAYSKIPRYKWAITVLSGLIIAVAGTFLWRPVAALYFSTAGTILVFAGMVLLLFYKGLMPVSRICLRPSMYLAVFAAMVAFGVTEQLLLCRDSKPQSAGKDASKGSNKK